jgi:hypothetical protein
MNAQGLDSNARRTQIAVASTIILRSGECFRVGADGDRGEKFDGDETRGEK